MSYTNISRSLKKVGNIAHGSLHTVQSTLTFQCASYFSVPFVHKGSLLGARLKKYFPVGILFRNFHHICKHLRHKSASFIHRFKVAVEYQFSFFENSHVIKIKKNNNNNNNLSLETSYICILLSARWSRRNVHFDKRMIFFLRSLL